MDPLPKTVIIQFHVGKTDGAFFTLIYLHLSAAVVYKVDSVLFLEALSSLGFYVITHPWFPMSFTLFSSISSDSFSCSNAKI